MSSGFEIATKTRVGSGRRRAHATHASLQRGMGGIGGVVSDWRMTGGCDYRSACGTILVAGVLGIACDYSAAQKNPRLACGLAGLGLAYGWLA